MESLSLLRSFRMIAESIGKPQCKLDHLVSLVHSSKANARPCVDGHLSRKKKASFKGASNTLAVALVGSLLYGLADVLAYLINSTALAQS